MCTRILWYDKKKFALPVVGRVMDWVYDDYRPDIWILPKDGSRDGGTESKPIEWPITFGSLVVPVGWKVRRNRKKLEVASSTDGINEEGLAGHTLWLGRTQYKKPDGTKPALNIAKWLQYYLDQFPTVKEAVAHAKTEPFHLVPVNIGTIEGKLHLTLEDKSGDSAVIEYIRGKQHVHRGRGYSVITNSLTCDRQSKKEVLKYKAMNRGKWGKRLPGSTSSRHRFIRAWYYREKLPKAHSEREAVAYLLSVLRNVSYPFGMVDPFLSQDAATPSTRWRSVTNLRDRVYYFESTTSPNLFWVELGKLDFTRPQKLDLRGNPERDLFGDVSGEFVAVDHRSFEWPTPEDERP